MNKKRLGISLMALAWIIVWTFVMIYLFSNYCISSHEWFCPALILLGPPCYFIIPMAISLTGIYLKEYWEWLNGGEA